MAQAFDPLPPKVLGHSSLPSTLGLTKKVVATASLDNPRETVITWTPIIAAVRYIVYVSPSPMFKQKFKEVINTQTTALFEIPIVVPTDLTFYFWVSFINAFNQETFIQEEPVFTLINSAFDQSTISPQIARDISQDNDMSFYFEEIRRRHQFILENDGEDFFLHIRRRLGQPCVCTEKVTNGRVVPIATGFMNQHGKTFDPVTPEIFESTDSKDPEYQGNARCEHCFGTGISGGYFPKIRIRVRYGEMPLRVVNPQQQGFEFRHDFNSWTLWHPKIKQNDMIIRIRDNERFAVNDPAQSEMRGIPFRQIFTAKSFPDTDIVYKVSDQAILDGLAKQGSWDLAKFDWAVFS